MTRRYTASELIERPTLSNINGLELKVKESNRESGTGLRVWLWDVPGEDRMVVVEQHDPTVEWPGLPGHAAPPSGGWVETDRYEPEDDAAPGPESGNCVHCGKLVRWDRSVAAYIDDDTDEFCPDGDRHTLPTQG